MILTNCISAPYVRGGYAVHKVKLPKLHKIEKYDKEIRKIISTKSGKTGTFTSSITASASAYVIFIRILGK